MTPGIANISDSPRARTLKWRYRSNGPDAQQSSLRIALDLHGQQHHLQQNHAAKQHQRSMSRGNARHVFSLGYAFVFLQFLSRREIGRLKLYSQNVSAGPSWLFPPSISAK